MVLCGGLELVVGAYIIHEHQKHKKERKQLEDEIEAKKDHEKRRRRRRHSSSPSRSRPTRPPHKHGYTSGPVAGAGKPAAAMAGLYSQQSPPPAYYSPNQNHEIGKLAIPQPPQDQNRPNSVPSQWGYAPPNGPPFAYSPPIQHQPPATNYPHNSPYYTPPLLYSNDHRSQAPNHQPNSQGPPYPYHTGGVYGAGGDWHSRSDTSLPMGIYEPSEEPYAGPYELSAEGPWMQDAHRTAHQRPHVRIRLPNDAVVQPGVDSARSPPPAYQAYRPW